MNNRITELAAQCGFRPAPSIYDRNQSFDIEKFAVLIVRECAIVCETVGDVAEAVGSGDQARYSRETAHGCAGMIKDMFGVE
jgi:hypothetical protein